jgi:hypothetical protein
MATLNTQIGYKPPRTPGTIAPKPIYTQSAGLARALSGVSSSYTNPYSANVTSPGSPQLPADERTGLSAGPVQTPTLPTVPRDPSATSDTYTPQAPVAPPAPPGFQFDLTTDPVLQQIMAAADTARTNANTAALAQQKQLAIQYGDKEAGARIDQSTGEAAAGNPYGVYQNLANQYATGQHNLDENLNAHNLFYSGERINELAQALSNYQQAQAQAAGAEQTAYGNIDANRIAALMAADQNVQQGYSDAYSRALAWALAHLTTPTQPTYTPGTDTTLPFVTGPNGQNVPIVR